MALGLSSATPASARAGAGYALIGSEYVGPAIIIALAAVIDWAANTYPGDLPVWMPWDYAPSEFPATVLPVFWYLRGLAIADPAERPNWARRVSFLTGATLMYIILETHFEYDSQHMFFMSRVDHLVMHHLGPFLIALGWPGAMIARGMPAALLPVFDNKPVHRVLRFVQHPVVAGILFVGIIDFWLFPPIQFDAMINPWLYDLMNWTMSLDGLLFWFLLLDPRPCPPARISFPARMATLTLVMFPQIGLGSYLSFSNVDHYTIYDICGRLFPTISAITDQHLGGMIVWIPASMMSSVGFMLTLNNMRLVEEYRPPEEMTEEERAMAVAAARWTGR